MLLTTPRLRQLTLIVGYNLKYHETNARTQGNDVVDMTIRTTVDGYDADCIGST